MDTDDSRRCPHVVRFRCPMMPGLECPEMAGLWEPGSVEAKAAFCRMEARRAGLDVPEPGQPEPKRFRK